MAETYSIPVSRILKEATTSILPPKAIDKSHEIPHLPSLTSTFSRPIPNSYWATPLLLACEYPWTPKNPTNPKLDSLLRAGVRTFIDLTESGELHPYWNDTKDHERKENILLQRARILGIPEEEIEYHRFPIRDRSLPGPHPYRFIHGVLSTLQDAQQRNRISAVHCRGGIGRTGVVVGCWLVNSGVAKDGEDALGIIAREWKSVEKCKQGRYLVSPETGDQYQFVLGWQGGRGKKLRVN